MAEEAFVEVSGEGAATTTPDRLRVHLAAECRAPTLAQPFEEADSALRAMLVALRGHGATDEDLRSTGVEVYSDRERRGSRGGFFASMSVEAMLRDIGSAGAAVSAAVEAGGDASPVQGVPLAATTTHEALTRARALTVRWTLEG